MAKDIAEEFNASLADLRINSKPHINMLTMLAEDYLEHAPVIVKSVEAHLQNVRDDIKLPVLYLIDSIVKNVGKDYITLFAHNIVLAFCTVFERVDEKIRSQMFKLRQTWNEIFPTKILYELDVRVNTVDPAWPITANPSHAVRIHVNPKFFQNQFPLADGGIMREELLKQQKELLELQKRKVELELLQTKAILEEQQKKLENHIKIPEKDGLVSFRSRDPRMRAKQNINSSVPETKDKPLPKCRKDKKKSKENRIKNDIEIINNNSDQLKDDILTKSPVKEEKNGEMNLFEDKTSEIYDEVISDTESDIQICTPEYDNAFPTDNNSTGSCSSGTSQESFNARPTKRKMEEDESKSDQIALMDSLPSLGINSSQDVDLRLLTNKTEDSKMMDTLFGDEDVDLRQCAPQPISIEYSNEKSWANIKKNNDTSPDIKKLKRNEKPRRSFVYDRDDSQSEESDEKPDNCNLIIKQAEEQLNNGNITFSQYNRMLKAVITMNEERKLQEAVWKDELEGVPFEEKKDELEVEQPARKKYCSVGGACLNPVENSEPPDINGFQLGERKIPEYHEHITDDRRFPRFYPSRANLCDPWRLRGGHKGHRPMFRWPHLLGPRPMFETKPPFRFPERGGHQFHSGPGGFREVPRADPHVLDIIAKDTMHTIDIDRTPHQVRFYGETAVILLSWDDPRELSFYPGSGRVIIDDRDVLVLQFNSPYREFNINGIMTKIRFGAPTRELYVDGIFYEASFGGAPVQVMIGNMVHSIQLSGPLPQVRVGNVQRTDLVAGKINMIVDAKHIYPIYLDAKPQRFDISGVPYILRFVEALQTVVINGVPFKIEFGGNLPVPMFFHGEKHFLRFSVLPRGIKPGYVNIVNMEGGRLPTPPPMLGPLPPRVMMPPDVMQPPPPAVQEYQAQPEQSLELLVNLMSTTTSQPRRQNYNIEIESIPKKDDNINVGELLKKLVAVGIVPPASEGKSEEEEPPTMKPVDFNQPDTLKMKQPGLIAILYSGIQCSSCGVRFPPEQTVKYSQHLDWHFRQNRRDRDTVKKVLSRRWNYDVSDWIQYQEIEEEEERPESWFEIQEKEEESQSAEPVEEESCESLRDEENTCNVCHDRFDQFYNGEKEEWQLKRAVRIEGRLYHPLCHKDRDQIDTCEILNDTIEIDDQKVERKEPQSDDDDILEVKVLEKTVEFYELSDEEPEEMELGQETFEDQETIQEICDIDIDFTTIKIKQERIDSTSINPPAVVSSIDGNTQLSDTAPIVRPKIKINITSSLSKQDKSSKNCTEKESQEGSEELNYPAAVKPRIAQAKMDVLDPVEIATEMSALCSIM